MPVTKTYSVIDINGNRYDAVTGQLAGAAKKVASQVRNAPAGVIDGFTRRNPSPSKLPVHNMKAKPKAEPTKSHSKSSHRPAQSLHRNLQRSHALMRSVVSKPGSKPSADNTKTVRGAHHQELVDTKRASRAIQVVKNTQIRRFGSNSGLVPQMTSATQAHTSAPARAVVRSKPGSNRSGPSIVDRMSSQRLERLLDEALLRADSHKNSSGSRKSNGHLSRGIFRAPRWASMAAGLAVVLLLGGFFTWQNVPQVSMRLAASRAKIPGSVPSYTPSGFSFSGPIWYSNGEVSVKFKANGDHQRTFTITQRKTNWDSQSLAENTLKGSSGVQTSQINGTTVYIYGAMNDASWVNEGVLYSLKDKASLTSDQILKIAGSM